MKPVEIYLAAYLETLDAQLNDLPPARRIEIIGETREHLEAILAARISDGMDENEAWRNARNAFGDAENIGRQLAREWKRAPRVETEGTPLTKREKMILFARPVVWGALFMCALTVLNKDPVLKAYWGNLLLAIFSFGCFTFGVGRSRRAAGKWTPATIFMAALCFVQLAWANLHLTFGEQMRGTQWDTVSEKGSFVMIPLLFIASFWLKKEAKSTLPWRQMSLYASNPIAAEETYRLSPKIGLALGVTFGCVGNLWMASFFGLPVAIGLCVGEIALAWLYARFVMGN